jgi:hypothetical protein
VYAARVAARRRSELGTEVAKIPGRYGELKVRVDGEAVIEGGSLAL